MKPPTRLLDGPATELELQLLRAGSSDEPPPGALQRMADTLGVQVAEAAAHLPALPPAAAVSSTSALGIATGKLALVLAAGLAIAGGAWLATRPASDAPAPSPPAPVGAVESAPASQPSAATSSAPAASSLQPNPAAPSAPAPAAAATSGRPAPAVSPPSPAQLSEEIDRLDAVRRLLASRRAAAALGALASYQRDYPAGALRQEAALLRIEALRRSGDRTGARTLARQFLAESPDSPHAARVRALASERPHAR